MTITHDTATTLPQLITPKQLVEKHPAFNLGGVYTLIFNEEKNGLKKSGAILRIGKKIYIDEVKWFGWIRKINNQP